MPDVIICYEHINREILNDTLLKEELQRRGFTCEIIPFNGYGFSSFSKKRNRSKVVLTPWLRYDDDVYHYLQLANKNACLINLQCEQVYNFAGLINGMTAINGQSKSAFHLCWGSHSLERLFQSGIDKKHLFVTGALQLDFQFPLFEHFFLNRDEISREFCLDSSKTWCLFVSSFGFANYDEHSLTQLEKQFGSYIIDVVNLHKTSQFIFSCWIRKLLRSNTMLEFIYRPHPSERTSSVIKELEMEFPNFHVISKYSIKQWAKVSDKVNLWISTSNAEILSMNVNYEIIRPISIPRELEVESMENDTKIDNIQDFIDFNTNLRPFSKGIDERKKLLQEFYDLSGVPSFVRIADVVEEAITDGFSCNFHFSNVQRLKFWYRDFKDKIISRLAENQLNNPNRNCLWCLFFRHDIQKNILRGNSDYLSGKSVEKDFSSYLHRERSIIG